MTSIIVLSSSPPRAFARSPTPIEFSASPKFKSSKISYAPASGANKSPNKSFPTTRHILQPKSTSENVPLGSPCPPKFKLTLPDQSSFKSTKPISRGFVSPSQKKQNAPPKSDWDKIPDFAETVVKILPSDARRKKKADTAPLQLEKATVRKTDWTPPRLNVCSFDGAADDGSFGINLAQFGHVEDLPDYRATAKSKHGGPTKKRKISLSSAGLEVPTAETMATVKFKAKPRSKSPVKKGLTITSLATSHYLGEEKRETTPMIQYLLPTEARVGQEDPDVFDTTVKKRNNKPKKGRKSRLRSPTTALETIDSQEFIFASASQLARDESPTLLKDTIEATKRLEQDNDETTLTQETLIMSMGSTTPEKTGTARFRRCRSLFKIAHRDEDDALLHLEDDMNAPLMGEAFAGKEALFQHAVAVPGLDEADNSVLLLKAIQHDGSTTNIDDIATPPIVPKVPTFALQNSYSITSASSSSKRTTEEEPQRARPASVEPQKKIPPKPNYVSWTDEELKKETKKQGHKRLRARDSMIAKLDEGWAAKYGLDPAAVKKATKSANTKSRTLDQGDFLRSVHDLAARQTSKVEKARAKKKVDEEGQPKRKGKTKAQEHYLSEEVVDLSDIDEASPASQLPLSTAPVKGTGVKGKLKTKEGPLTPPPTLPHLTQDSSPGFEDLAPSRPVSQHGSSQADPEHDIKLQIPRALKQPPANDSTRNHQKNPTWHEKILMYDPIVLEDFTAWLNMSGFNRIGEDREIDIADVKSWCEANGICCLWKGGWRGNKKKTKPEE